MARVVDQDVHLHLAVLLLDEVPQLHDAYKILRFHHFVLYHVLFQIRNLLPNQIVKMLWVSSRGSVSLPGRYPTPQLLLTHVSDPPAMQKWIMLLRQF